MTQETDSASATPPNAPSSRSLLRATLVAVGVATVLLVGAVLPAEFGVDPTGIGRVLGLTQMGEIKMSLAREAAAEDAADAEAAAAEEAQFAAQASVPPADTAWTHVTVVPLAPGEGKEVKLVMVAGATAEYAWQTDGGVVNHDTHGDSTGAPNSYIGYARGTGVTADSGSLVAQMDGSHGWFWRNRGSAPVAITLRTRGAYSELKKMY